ncbi:unnamed protein product [Rotaria socialis]|uniref:Uncharacterized protein n=1 Tax=Rotaria socialis TaxID=392032 RepID=A0A822C0I8_9BILA|nr:unnamed protein product [Rotaria socialis]CAF4664804.1 unnamed protein product [Rotaria socialis]CAF5019213.1 unnamed protein product [Rotaria socialis]
MKDFSTLFHKLWDDCFADTAITNITPIVGSKRLHNLHDYLVKKKPDRLMLTMQKQCPTTTPTTTDISNGNDHKILNNPSGKLYLWGQQVGTIDIT